MMFPDVVYSVLYCCLKNVLPGILLFWFCLFDFLWYGMEYIPGIFRHYHSILVVGSGG